MNLTFRTTPEKHDIKRIMEIVESTGFFYDHEIEIAVELVTERLAQGESTGYYFIFAEVDGITCAYSCFGPIPMSKTCFDLYWIVTHNDFRGKGIGKKLLEETCNQARGMGCKILIAETSGQEHYSPTRAFYDNNKFVLEARLKDFYDIGDDKLFYTKIIG
jgi:GNAT superfamily N-acetyltransferase